MRILHLFLLTAGLICGALHAGEASRSPVPVNLARPACGARLTVEGVSADSASPDVLLRDDDPLGYQLAAGDTAVTLTLPQVEVVKRFNFLNLTASGRVSIAVSSVKAPNAWREVQSAAFSGAEVVNCDFGSIEAREVKVTFHLDAPGRVDTFGLFGLRTVGSSNRLASAGGQDGKMLMYNYAVSPAGAGVVMVSPGEDITAAQSLVDGDMGTSFTFQPTDSQPMAIVDLGERRSPERVSIAYKAGPGELRVYLVDAHGKGTRTVAEVVGADFPAGYQPVLSVETGAQPGLNRASAPVSGQSGRFLVMDFHPAGGDALGGGDFKDVDFKDADFKDAPARPVGQAATAQAPLEVAELSVFGAQPPTSLALNLPPVLPPGTSVNALPPSARIVAPTLFPPSGVTSIISP